MTMHILLARQRSGTGAFGSVLDQHPDIRYLGEVFHPNEITREESYFNFLLKRISDDPRRGLPNANEQNFDEYMKHLAATVTSKANIVIDVKYSSTHHFNGPWYSPTDMPKFIQYAKRDKMKIIHLKRRNYVKTFVSGRLAETNKVWHATHEGDLSTRQIHIDKQALLNYLNSTGRIVNHFDGYLSKNASVIEVEYEELFPRDGGIDSVLLKKVSDFLGVDESPFEHIRPSFVKQTSDRLSDVVINYEEVSKFIANTAFADMIGN